MTKEQASKLPKYVPNPLLAGLPAYLKDPLNYNKIQKTLLEILAGQHSHSEILGWHNCLTCQNKMMNLRMAIKKLGFKNQAQFMAWKKTMEIIINPKRMPLK